MHNKYQAQVLYDVTNAVERRKLLTYLSVKGCEYVSVREVFSKKASKGEVYFLKNLPRHVDSILLFALGWRSLALGPML